MSTIRWGVIASVIAFVISLCLGIVAGNQALRTFLTAIIFGLTFFGIGFGLRIMINNFFPELLFIDSQTETADSYEEEEEEPKASFTLENSGEYAVPEMYRIPGKNPKLGNIEELISGVFVPREEGVDGRREAGYNNLGSSAFSEVGEIPLSDQQEIPSQPQVFTPSLGDDEGLGGLPDLDLMAMAFSGVAGEGPRSPSAPAATVAPAAFDTPPPAYVQDANEPDRSQYKGNKPQAMEGDFDAKEIAMGIRTVLNKDK